MRKIAFFVEGQTEQIFINRLLREILGTKQINIIQKQFRGGVNSPKQELVRSLYFSNNPKFQVLIFDCGADNRVKSEILENIKFLHAKGYHTIVGMRDLYPLSIDDLYRLEKGLKFLPNKLKDKIPNFDIVIAVHEIEAWFMGEVNHYKKIDKRLTGKFIKSKLGFDPYTINPEERIHPAKDLNNIYHLVGKSYTKRYGQIQKIVNKLDFNYIFNHVRYDIQPLNKLIKIIENINQGLK